VSALAAAAWAYAVLVSVLDARTLPVLGPEDPPAPGPPSPVTAIVPARDEARAVRETLSRLRAQDHPDLQVIAVDDGSRDATLAEMRSVEGVEVVEGQEPPPGWFGKPWACHQGVARARGEWLLFVDADVRLEPGAVRAALALAARAGQPGATAFPRLETGSAAERVVLPLAGVVMQSAVIPSWAARLPGVDLAVGVGGFLLVRRDLYERLGGHAAVRGEVVEDLALARAAKRAGHLLPWADGRRLISLRYYHGAGEMWRGWRKNASQAWQAPPVVALLSGGVLGAVVLAPWVSVARGRRSGAVGLALQVAALRRVARGTDVGPAYALTGPLGALFLGAVGAASALDRLRGRGPRWRGRSYPATS